MVRQKVFELSVGAQVDNVIFFSKKENDILLEVKEILELKNCGVTKACISNSRINPYNCDCFEKCNKVKNYLKPFI